MPSYSSSDGAAGIEVPDEPEVRVVRADARHVRRRHEVAAGFGVLHGRVLVGDRAGRRSSAPSSPCAARCVSVFCTTIPRAPCSPSSTAVGRSAVSDPPAEPAPTWPGDAGVGSAFSHGGVAGRGARGTLTALLCRVVHWTSPASSWDLSLSSVCLCRVATGRTPRHDQRDPRRSRGRVLQSAGRALRPQVELIEYGVMLEGDDRVVPARVTLPRGRRERSHASGTCTRRGPARCARRTPFVGAAAAQSP